MKGAKGVLINITGGHDMTLFEVDEAANASATKVDPDANIIVGARPSTRADGRQDPRVGRGWKSKPADEPAAPAAKPVADDESFDDELEIPAFLRRSGQA
jgi:cell division protein FtsZ